MYDVRKIKSAIGATERLILIAKRSGNNAGGYSLSTLKQQATWLCQLRRETKRSGDGFHLRGLVVPPDFAEAFKRGRAFEVRP